MAGALTGHGTRRRCLEAEFVQVVALRRLLLDKRQPTRAFSQLGLRLVGFGKFIQLSPRAFYT